MFFCRLSKEKNAYLARNPTDIQLKEDRARFDVDIFTKWLRRAFRAGAQLGAGGLAGDVAWCHVLTAYE